MSKKDYQIKVVSAEDLKNQNNLPNKEENPQDKPQDLKTGFMIGGLVTFFLSVCFLIFTLYFLFITYSSDNNAQNAVTFVVFILSIGWMSYIPGAICAIISLCLNPFVIKSSSKKQKVIGIIFTILSVILILAFLIIAIYIITLPNS